MKDPPIKGALYAHQNEAYNLVCRLFGVEGGDVQHSISSRGAALLMEM